MTPLKINIGTWQRSRTNAVGKAIKQKRHTVNYRCPDTGQKRRLSFATKLEAEEHREALLQQYNHGRYFNPNTNPTVLEVSQHWLDNKRGNIKPQTIHSYKPLMKIITGPLLQGTPKERGHFALTGEKPNANTPVLQMLGHFKVSELQTSQLRRWHNQVREEVGADSANRCMTVLKSILALAEEDFGVRVCSIPTNLARRKSKPRKVILTPEEVSKLLEYAKQDPERGIYYAFPFYTGVRISEQLGLLWEDVDFNKTLIHIRRIQYRDGTTTDTTKTEAGVREIPLSESLRQMLIEWRLRCPRLDGELYRVFPGLGARQQWPLPRKGGGGPLRYDNYLKRFWKPALKKANVRYVTHHSARHSFVSTLQAQGVEVGLVAKLAGHANPAVTLGHYTQAIRGGEEAVAILDNLYTGQGGDRGHGATSHHGAGVR